MFFLLPAVASCLAYAQSTNALTEQIVELFTYEPGFVNKGETDHIKSDFSYVKKHFFRPGDYFFRTGDYSPLLRHATGILHGEQRARQFKALVPVVNAFAYGDVSNTLTP